MLGISMFPLSTVFRQDFKTVPTVLYFSIFVFYFIHPCVYMYVEEMVSGGPVFRDDRNMWKGLETKVVNTVYQRRRNGQDRTSF